MKNNKHDGNGIIWIIFLVMFILVGTPLIVEHGFSLDNSLTGASVIDLKFSDGNLTSLLGTHSFTKFDNVSNAIVLDDVLHGTFTSEIFYVGSNVSWNEISWTEGLPYGDALINEVDNVLLMHFDDNPLKSTKDSSGENNVGACFRESCPASVEGKFGNAYDFNGTNDAIDISYNNSLNFTNALTIETWIYIDTFSEFDSIVGQAHTAFEEPFTTYGLALADNNNFYFGITTNGERVMCRTEAGSVVEGKWMHIAGVWDGIEIKTYINGELNGTPCIKTGDLEVNDMPLNIGSYPYQGSNFLFDGKLDELAIYSKALNADEILDHYKRGVMKLNVSVRSCNDENCSTDWQETFYSPGLNNLSVNNSSYFQYKVEFETTDERYSPELYNVSILYGNLTSPVIEEIIVEEVPYRIQKIREKIISLREDKNIRRTIRNDGKADIVINRTLKRLRDKFSVLEQENVTAKVKLTGVDVSINSTIIIEFSDIEYKEIKLTTPIIAGKNLSLENAEITLPKNGNVNTILYCEDFNISTMECGEWKPSNISFNDDGENITFNATKFSAYGGGIILIIKAEHLDANRNFINNIYNETKKLDNIWSEEIPNGDYVRVVFERNLTSYGDITIYPRTISGNPKIEVYEKNGTIKIAEFSSINSNEYNKVLLTNLISESQDVFDLKIVGGSLEFDHIIDPSVPFETGIVDTNGWTTVNLMRTYTLPIVVASPREGFEVSADLEVSTAVITNITSNSFRVQLYNESNDALAGNVSYIVVENGTHTLSNGMLLQAGRIDGVSSYNANGAGGTSYQSITFGTAYGSAPVVVASPNNDSAQDWVATRYNTGTLTTSGIDISLEIDQAYGTGPIASSSVGNGQTNSIAWIAINRTSATDMEAALEAAVDEDPATADWRVLTFSNTYTTPLFFGLGEESGGTDPATVGRQNLNKTNVDIRRTEERTDGEQSHATEDTLWMVFESELGNSAPTIPTNVTCNGGDCNISVDTSVELNASGSTDSEGDNITYFIEASLLNATTSADQESGEKQAIATGGGTVIGETGNVTANDSLVWTFVNYQNTYSSTPVVIATPVTYANCPGTCSGTGAGNGGMYPIPLVKDVSTTGFNFSMCVDGGNTTCTTSASSETFDYFVFDVDAVSSLSWIDVGTLTVTTAGADTTLNYGKTFTNTPVIWTTPQTYNQNGNIATVVWAEDTATKSTTSAPLIGCVHQGIANACTTGQPSETVGYVAIDTANADISTFQTGSADISSSAWTAATFSPTYTNPHVMVTQNDDDGGEDPEYAWAKDVTGSGMSYRYCEEDAGDVCNSHTGEVTNWFAIEQGDLAVGSGTSDTEATKDWETYNDVSPGWKNITELNVTVEVSVYNNSGSTQNGNNNPDLQLEAYNSSDFVHVGNFSVNGIGNFSLIVNDLTILTGWQTSADTDLRIRGINLDYFDTSNIDEINWTGVWIAINGTEWNVIGNHTNTTTFVWNTTNIAEQNGIDLRARAIDIDGTNTYSSYFTKNSYLNISHAAANQAPTITDISNIPDQSITEGGISYVEFSVFASDENGVDDLNDTNLNATFSKTGETTRINSSCSWISDINATTANYTCTIGLWYWDGAGTWNVNATILDLSGVQSPDYNEIFTLLETTAMVMNPTSLTWASLSMASTNSEATSNITINNTANANITAGNVKVTAVNLQGNESNSSQFILAADFTVNTVPGCEGTAMVNGSPTGVSGATLPKGNVSLGTGEGQEGLYFCLEQVTAGINQQSYTTSGENSTAWTIAVG